MSIVRDNLMNREGYTPYCGNQKARDSYGGCHNPRTYFTGEQFKCYRCGWQSSFPADFINQYKEKWAL